MSNHGKLNKIGNEKPFRVPENYFRDLPDKIMERCEQDEQKRSFVQIIKPALSLAAMFIGVALIAYFALQLIDRPAVQVPYNQHDIAEAEYYDQYYNQNELLEGDIQDDTEETQVNSKQTQKYIEYLLNEDIDYTTLINELEEGKGQQKGEEQ
jgi:hypothetical protein